MNKPAVRAILIAVVLIWTLIPIYWFLKMAFLSPAEIARFPPPLYPLEPQLAAFYNVVGYSYTTDDGLFFRASGQAGQVLSGLKNSFIVAVIVMLITMVVVVPLSYVFARLEFRHKTKLLFAILLAVALPPISTMIPFYALFVQLDLVGTIHGLVIVTLTITIPFVTWMLIGYFRNLPPVERLARIDGFSRFMAFLRIIVPLARSGIAVGAVVSFLFAWNEYTFAQILVNGTKATTLPASVSGFLYQVPEPSQLAASIFFSLIPPLIVAYFLQRHIAEMNLVEPLR